MNTIYTINLIISNPKIRGGKPIIAGTTLRVSDVVIAMQYHQRTAEQIAEDFAISLAQTHAALAHYYQHQDEIDADIQQQIAEGEALYQDWLKNNDSLLP